MRLGYRSRRRTARGGRGDFAIKVVARLGNNQIHPGGGGLRLVVCASRPLTGNDKGFNSAKGTVPGVGVIHVDAGDKVGHYNRQAAITNMKDGKETADTHRIAVRK